MGHKFHSAERAKLKCVSLLYICFFGGRGFFLLLLSKMQTVFTDIWDYHIHKPILLEQKLLNRCPLYNRLCLYRGNVHVWHNALKRGDGSLLFWKTALKETWRSHPCAPSRITLSFLFCRSSVTQNAELPLTMSSSALLLFSMEWFY